MVANETECRLGDKGLEVLLGDTDADRLGGEPGGVSRGVLVCDTNRGPYDDMPLPGFDAEIRLQESKHRMRKRSSNKEVQMLINLKCTYLGKAKQGWSH